MNSIFCTFSDGSIIMAEKSDFQNYYFDRLKDLEYKDFLSNDNYFFSDAEVKLFFAFCERKSLKLKPLAIKASSRQKIWNEIKKLELLKEII